MKKDKREISIVRSSAAEYLTFVASTGADEKSIEMRYEDENIWLTQKMMAALYDVDVRTINDHIKKIYSDSELEQSATIRKYRIVQTEGSREVAREVNHYNLQMIISVGFKVNNERAVQFRKWANQIVKDYTIQGWVMDDDRLKNSGTVLTKEYFEKQLEKSVRFVFQNENFIRKLPIFMPQLWTMTLPQRLQNAFLQRCKTNCITVFMGKQQPRLSTTEQMQKRNIWGLPHGTARQKVKFMPMMLW